MNMEINIGTELNPCWVPLTADNVNNCLFAIAFGLGQHNYEIVIDLILAGF